MERRRVLAQVPGSQVHLPEHQERQPEPRPPRPRRQRPREAEGAGAAAAPRPFPGVPGERRVPPLRVEQVQQRAGDDGAGERGAEEESRGPGRPFAALDPTPKRSRSAVT